MKMTPVDASNNPEEVRYTVTTRKTTPKLKIVHYIRNADKRNFFSKEFTSNWNRII